MLSPTHCAASKVSQPLCTLVILSVRRSSDSLAKVT